MMSDVQVGELMVRYAAVRIKWASLDKDTVSFSVLPCGNCSEMTLFTLVFDLDLSSFISFHFIRLFDPAQWLTAH